jgi:SAM-dependent methyltransferase
MTEHRTWTELVRDNPDHSAWYVERFRSMAAAGADLDGEARMVDAMLARSARVLDAGCGGGRVGGYLHRVGHAVVGVDIDPVLVTAAGEDHPGPAWLVGDLAALDLPARAVPADFDVIVSAGNVMTFVDPSSRREVLRRLTLHLAPAGRLVIGFGAQRGYGFDEFLDGARANGLEPELLLSSWDLRPFDDGSDFLVAVLRTSDADAGAPS